MLENIGFSRLATALLLALCVSACTSGHDTSDDNSSSDDSSGDSTDTGSSTPSASDLTLLTSAPSLDSAASGDDQAITITAIVRDDDNNAVSGDTVNFSASSGLIQPVDSGQTQSNGVATATLTTAGNPANRTITVTASADSESARIEIPVSGTALAIDGPGAVASGQTADLTATLTDSAGDGIGNQPIDVTSALGNTIQSGSLQTNAQGVARFSLRGDNTGDDTVTVSALGAASTHTLQVGGNSFTLGAPAGGSRIPTGRSVAVKSTLLDSGDPVSGRQIDFTSTRGRFENTSATTDNNGLATASLSSTDAGPATITASTPDGQSASVTVQFVATEAASITLQASPATVDTGGNSTLTAVVRDDDDNPVSGVAVNFTLTDASGGAIQPARATSDDSGRAIATYTAGSSSTGEPATVNAAVGDAPDVSDTASITVGGQALRVALGTSGDIDTSDDGTSYVLPYVALVTDAAGNPITSADFELSVQSLAYQEGMKVPDAEDEYYVPVYQAPATASDFGCGNEDLDHDGILDEGEDTNDNGVLDPGNVASVPRTAELGDDGTANFNLTYPKNFSGWVKVRLRVTAAVQGSETMQNAFFVLPAAADDVSTSIDGDPPGVTSPFGTDGVCATTYDPDSGEEP